MQKTQQNPGPAMVFNVSDEDNRRPQRVSEIYLSSRASV
jgi:hypothetical protein